MRTFFNLNCAACVDSFQLLVYITLISIFNFSIILQMPVRRINPHVYTPQHPPCTTRTLGETIITPVVVQVNICQICNTCLLVFF